MEVAALLAAATLFGGMTLYSFGFAPLLFTRLPGEQAAKLLREAFPWYYLFTIVTAAVAGLLVVALDPFSAALLAMTLAVGVVARQLLMPAINRARDASLAGGAEGAAEPARADARRAAKRRFERLHGLSVALNFAQLGAVGWALARFV